jgi:hypothetical protein
MTNLFQLIFEMAMRKSIAEEKITELSIPIIHHLIKIFKWEDDINRNKHINDINSWIRDIQNIKLKTKTGRFKESDYFRILFIENVPSKQVLTRIIAYDLSKYSYLTVINGDEIVYNKLNDICTKISQDLAKNDFKSINLYF